MVFEGLKLETSGNGQKITQKEVQDRLEQISQIQNHIQNITQGRDPKIKDRLANSHLKREIMSFIEDAANNRLGTTLSEYNATKYDKNGTQGLDKYEFEQFSNSLNIAIEQIIILDGMKDMRRIHEESAEMSLEKRIAKYVNIQSQILGKKNGVSFAEAGLQRAGLSEEQLKKMGEKKFDISSQDSWKELGILLSKDFGDCLEDVMRLLLNIPAGIILLPRYLYHRGMQLSDNPKRVVEGEIKNNELVEDNPSLALGELFSEKGPAILKQLGEMFISGKQGDIANLLITLAGMVAGGATVFKSFIRMGRKSLIKTARELGREGRLANTGNNLARQTARVAEQGAGKVAQVASSVDNTIMTGGLNYLVGPAGKIAFDTLDKAQKTKVYEKLVQNFPLLEVMRLVPGETIVNINMTGIKQINDIAGQAFTDKVSARFREILERNFHKSIGDGAGLKGRTVKNDYKNIAFVTPSNNPLKTIFGEYGTKDQIVSQILRSLKSDIEANSRLIAEGLVKEGKIKPSQMEEFIGQKIKATEQVVRDNFDFGVGCSRIPEGADDIQKLACVREAEISSRPNTAKVPTIELKKYSHGEIISGLRGAFETEEVIIEQFSGKQFRFNGVDYNAIFNVGGEKRISPELLRYVRKYPNRIEPKELVAQVQKYINSLNSSLDFISPVRGELAHNANDFEVARRLNKQIREGVVDGKYLLETHKGGLSKEAFFTHTEGKKGTRVLVDIKDMGIENVSDFALLGKKILTIQKKFESGLITELELRTIQDKLFLEAGKSVTDKFIKADMKIKELYPNAVLSFGGDEIFIFVPGESDISKLTGNLARVFDSTGQKARITIDNSSVVTKSEQTYTILDKTSKVNKIVEELMEGQLVRKGLSLEGNVPNSTFARFSSNLRDTIMHKGFDLDTFLVNFKKAIERLDLTQKGNLHQKGVEVQKGIRFDLTSSKEGALELVFNN